MNKQERIELLAQVHNCNGDGATDCMSLHTYAAEDALEALLDMYDDDATLASDIDRTIAVLLEFKREVVVNQNPEYSLY